MRAAAAYHRVMLTLHHAPQPRGARGVPARGAVAARSGECRFGAGPSDYPEVNDADRPGEEA